MARMVTIITSLLVLASLEGLWYALKYLRARQREKKALEPSYTSHVVFFTDRGTQCYIKKPHSIVRCSLEECPKRNLRTISEHLLSATTSLDICMYIIVNANLAKKVQKLIKKGVKVRVICDKKQSEQDGSMIWKLRNWGAFVQTKSHDVTPPVSTHFIVRELHMHHKFVIIDNRLLLTGSMNWSKEAVEGSWEHMVITSQPQLIAPFKKEFENLWGTWEDSKLPSDSVNADEHLSCGAGGRVPQPFCEPPDIKSRPEFHQVFFFSPNCLQCRPHLNSRKRCGQDCSYNVIKFITDLFDSASVSVDICHHQMTLDDVAEAVKRALGRGIKVRIIFDASMAGWSGSRIQKLIDEGVEIRMRKHDRKMHHKWIIFDNHLVLFGSANFTLQALCGNWENVVATTDPQLVKKFVKHYDYLWNYFLPQDIVEWGADPDARRN